MSRAAPLDRAPARSSVSYYRCAPARPPARVLSRRHLLICWRATAVHARCARGACSSRARLARWRSVALCDDQGRTKQVRPMRAAAASAGGREAAQTKTYWPHLLVAPLWLALRPCAPLSRSLLRVDRLGTARFLVRRERKQRRRACRSGSACERSCCCSAQARPRWRVQCYSGTDCPRRSQRTPWTPTWALPLNGDDQAGRVPA